MTEFDYQEAFQRNLGFLNNEEQTILRRTKVAIAGLGGTGGAQAHAIARTGIGAFHLADPDIFELANFNRQIGATMDTLNQPKAEVIKNIVLSINPEADIKLFNEGISPQHIDDFLDNVDIIVDSLDFYCFQERFLLYEAARKRKLWVLTAPPLGFGFTFLAFDPLGMSFEEYFQFNPQMSDKDLAIALILGISPKPYMFSYLNKEVMQIGQHRLPSVGAAPFMIAGVISAAIVKIILKKQKQISAPHIIQYDALLNKYCCYNPRTGITGLWQRLQRNIMKKKLLKVM